MRASGPTAYDAIQQAIQNLGQAINNLTTEEHDGVRKALLAPARLSAMEKIYNRSDVTVERAIAENWGRWDIETNVERFRQHGMDAQRIEAIVRLFVIEELQRTAVRVEDANRPVSPAFERVRERYNNNNVMRLWRECIAYNYLKATDRRLGIDSDENALLEEAIKELVDDLCEAPENESERYDAREIEDAMKELLGSEAARKP